MRRKKEESSEEVDSMKKTAQMRTNDTQATADFLQW